MTVVALMVPLAGGRPLSGLANRLTVPVTSLISLDIRFLPLTSTVSTLLIQQIFKKKLLNIMSILFHRCQRAYDGPQPYTKTSREEEEISRFSRILRKLFFSSDYLE